MKPIVILAWYIRLVILAAVLTGVYVETGPFTTFCVGICMLNVFFNEWIKVSVIKGMVRSNQLLETIMSKHKAT